MVALMVCVNAFVNVALADFCGWYYDVSSGAIRL